MLFNAKSVCNNTFLTHNLDALCYQNLGKGGGGGGGGFLSEIHPT